MTSRPIERERLHAYADGELSSDERADIAARLAEDPALLAEVAAWQHQKTLLHAAYDPTLAEPLPPALLAGVIAPPRRRLPRLAAALGWIALGAALGSAAQSQWSARSDSDPFATLPHRAAVAHTVFVPEVRHPVEVGADQEAHLAAWLSRRLDARLRIPRLLDQGFQLVGGRLIPSDSGPGALIMYEDSAGRRLTLYVCVDAKDSGTTAFRFARQDTLSTFYWVEGRSAYALSGELPRDALLPIATAIHRQLAGDLPPG